MKPRERVISAIAHREPDKTPKGEIYIDDTIVKDTVLCDQVDFSARHQFAQILGQDIFCVNPLYPEANKHLSAKEILFPDLKKWSLDTELYIFVMLDGPFGWGVRYLGFEKFLLSVAKQTILFKDILEKVVRLNKELISRAYGEGAHGILIADDIAYQRGLLVNPETLRESYFFALNSLVKHIKFQGMPAFFHSDGNLNDIIKDLINVGFDGLQCIEKGAGMDISRIKKMYGRHLCLWGNLDISELMLPCTEEELKLTVEDLISSVSYGGGYIFGTSSGLVRGINYNSMKSVFSGR